MKGDERKTQMNEDDKGGTRFTLTSSKKQAKLD